MIGVTESELFSIGIVGFEFCIFLIPWGLEPPSQGSGRTAQMIRSGRAAACCVRIQNKRVTFVETAANVVEQGAKQTPLPSTEQERKETERQARGETLIHRLAEQ